MLREFSGPVYPFITPSSFRDISIEDIISGWEVLHGPLTGLGYYPVDGLAEDISQQIAAYNALLGGGGISPTPPDIPPPEPYVPPADYIPPEGGEPMADHYKWYQLGVAGLSGEGGCKANSRA
jgi:hypothetical protein